jgi:DNA repair protein RadC
MATKTQKVRRKRLQQVLLPLLQLAEFTPVEAKQKCQESRAAYVTRTLRELVGDGVLTQFEIGGKTHFRWCQPPERFDPDSWIDSRIHGLQVKETPEPLRPRERLLRHGPASLNDAELLAILIRVGVPNESAVMGGQRIANRFANSMIDLTRLTPDELKEISPAATQSSFTQIMAGIELGRRIAATESDRVVPTVRITSTAEAVCYCQNKFARLASDAVQEEFHIVTLDTKHKPIRTHCITIGTLDASLVHPREVFRPAIRDSASAVLLVHNHPSGDPTPSREDVCVTDRLTDAGTLLGITVLDHIVVASERCVSIREET